MEHVAFYGTLRSDAVPLLGAPTLRGLVDVVGPCVLRGTLRDVGSYPGLEPGDGLVRGELCRVVSAEALAVLDAWEDYAESDEAGSEYLRRRVRLVEPDVEAWTYVANQPLTRLPIIVGGDWVAHVARHGVAPDAARWA